MKTYVVIKVWVIHRLQQLRILPKVWYASEIKLAEIRGKELSDFLNGRKQRISMIKQFNEITEHKDNNLIQGHPYDVGYDVRSGEDGLIPPGTASGWIYTGLHVCFPIWLCGEMLPRSGQLSQNIMVAGTIDPTYQGAIGIKIFNHHNSNPYRFKKGDRIAQMKISIAPEGFFDALSNGLVASGCLDFKIVESDSMDGWGESQRGNNGFGSTGIK